jgi:predicted nucleic acid-binding Zn ribbon protein
MELVPCPVCRRLCPPETERCGKCGCAVSVVLERERKQVRLTIIVIVVIFLLLLANSIFWATRL